MKTPFLLGGAALLLAGCATTDPQAALPAAQKQLTDRGAATIAWPQSDRDRAEADAAVRALLARDLTVDAAVRLALLNNRGLRATFEELGLSQADLTGASRLPNPGLSAGVRWPHTAPRGPNVDFTLTAPLLDLILLPLGRRVAADELAATQARVAHAVLALVAEVRTAAYAVLAQQDLRARLATTTELHAAAADLARRQFEAGNIPQLEFAAKQAAAQQAQVELARAEADVIAAREALNRLLGLARDQIAWTLPGPLPALPATDELPANLESLAQAQRLDLAALRVQADLADRALDLKRRTRLLPGSVDLGVNTERDSDGSRKSGPQIDLQLPLFSQGQPELARLAARSRQAHDHAAALAADIGSDVRAAHAALTAARRAAEFYSATLIPQHELLVREALLHYNAMQHSPYALLAAKADLLATEREAIAARRDYWLARTALERALGTALPPASSPPEAPPATAPASDDAHAHAHH